MRKIHESFALKKKDKTPPGWRNLWEWWRPSPHTMQWSHRETHTLIKTLAHPGVTHENWSFSDLSSHGGLRLLEAESETHKTTWNESEVTPGEVKLTRSTWAHYTSSLVSFLPDKFSLKWETESLKNRNKGVSESQPLTNTRARFMYHTYRAHTCKYLQVNWRNYTKTARLGSFWYSKIDIFVPTVRKGWPCSLWLLSWSF